MSPVSKGRKRRVNRKVSSRPRRTPAPQMEPGFDPTPYLADLPPGTEAGLDRRVFAIPRRSTTIDGEGYDGLDPADPDDRGLLIRGEHPEYNEVLADPLFDGELDGHNPRLHLTMHEVIANQLWDDDPPEVWQAARRLRDQDVGRHEILHVLADVMVRHMYPVLANKESFDTDAYRRDLDDLGRR
jgi:Domain of unknown function (DUF1841)